MNKTNAVVLRTVVPWLVDRYLADFSLVDYGFLDIKCPKTCRLFVRSNSNSNSNNILQQLFQLLEPFSSIITESNV